MSQDHSLEDRTRAAVAAAIEASDIKDADIANATGISRAMIGNYRAARYTPSLAKAIAIARCLDLRVDELAGAEPLPDRSLELAQVAKTLRDVAAVQAGLEIRLQDAASLLAPPAGQLRASGSD